MKAPVAAAAAAAAVCVYVEEVGRRRHASLHHTYKWNPSCFCGARI